MPRGKTPAERAEIRRQREARHDPGKSRSKHIGERSKKKVALEDLSGELPTEDELRNYQALVAKETDRGAALMASAFTEKSLWLAINCTINDPGETLRKQWFEGPLAPFSTFAAKIALGRVVNIYGEHMEKRLNALKQIRNQFAHAPRPISFEHPAIQESCKLLPPDGEKYQSMRSRRIYIASCLALAELLQEYAMKCPDEKIKPHFP